MKLEAFKPAPPVSGSGSDVPPTEPGNASPEAPQEEQYVTAVTPSGIEIKYSWAPRRYYKVCQDALDWADVPEVPSVTTVLGVLDKSGPLTWWGQGVGVEGTLELYRQKLITCGEFDGKRGLGWVGSDGWRPVDAKNVVDMLTQYKLTVNHVKDKAANRGVNVHAALEQTFYTGDYPDSQHERWQEHERGYVDGIVDFLKAINGAYSVQETQQELMVGSLEHSYAGRFDLVLTLSKAVEVVTRCYPKKPPKIETIPAGRYLMDLKTRKKASVYNTNFLQLEAYEHAAVECGYQPTDYRAVIVVTEDGGYQLSVNKDWCFEDFLAVRRCYQVLNEREVLRVLREDLDATEVTLTPGQLKTLKDAK